MKAYGHLSEIIETDDNFATADKNAAKGKKKRWEVKKFHRQLDSNLNGLQYLYRNKLYSVSPYKYRIIFEKKERMLAMLPYHDHVFHWAMLQPVESILDRFYDPNTYSCIRGRGQHKMIGDIREAILKGDSLYYASLDIKKMYQNIPLRVVKTNLRRKIKDPTLLHHFDTILDSSIGTPMGQPDAIEPTGLSIGCKISTTHANMALAYFDFDLRDVFGIAVNPALVKYYANEYVSLKFLTARTPDDMAELAKGVEYLTQQFKGYVKHIKYYYRFMDNMVILHRDKTFLHMLLDWIGLYLGGELSLTINPKWTIRPLSTGLAIVGYVIYPDGHIRVAKATKEHFIKQVNQGRKMGLSDEQIRRATSSLAGQIVHANSIHFFNKYGMEAKKERLGAKISRRRSLCPFEGMTPDQQRHFEILVYDATNGESETNYEMELMDYKIIDSIKDVDANGKPKPCLAIKYKWLGKPLDYVDERGRPKPIEPGQEYFSYSGSAVLIDQAQRDFSIEDLPAPTVIQLFTNRARKKFYKFT